jgi:hypothetical protein
MGEKAVMMANSDKEETEVLVPMPLFIGGSVR